MKKEYKPVHGMWTSRWVFILAATGSAVGLGNIWRFPYITGEYGGGAFVVLYLLCIALMGIPIMVAEVMLGRRGGLSPIHTMSKLAEQSKVTRRWAGIGYLGALSGFLILSFYSAVASWALIYVWEAAQGVFQGITAAQSKAHYEDMLANPWLLLGSHTLVMVITMGVVALGVKQGLERAVRVLMPVLFALLVVLIGYASTTPGFAEGVGFLFAFDFSKLSGEAVIVALGQAFFTLSLGMGAIMAYGAYMPREIKDKSGRSRPVSIVSSVVTIAVLDTLVALGAGLAMFPLLFTGGLEVGQGPGMMFVTLPGRCPAGCCSAPCSSCWWCARPGAPRFPWASRWPPGWWSAVWGAARRRWRWVWRPGCWASVRCSPSTSGRSMNSWSAPSSTISSSCPPASCCRWAGC